MRRPSSAVRWRLALYASTIAVIAVGFAPAVRAVTAAILPTNVTFLSDWSKAPATGTANNWAHKQVWTSSRIRGVQDDTSPKKGIVGSIQVFPGDKVGGWSGERAEYLGMQNRYGAAFPVTASSGHEFYGTSIKLPTTWKAPYGTSKDGGYTWGIFFQLHGPDSLNASPAIAMSAQKDFHISLLGGDVYNGGTRSSARGPASYGFSNPNLALGRWVQFMLDVVWKADKTGYLAVYRRDEGQTGWTRVVELRNVATLMYKYGNPVGPHYWKTGYYRNGGLNFTSQLWLGPTVRGTNFGDVALAAFGRR